MNTRRIKYYGYILIEHLKYSLFLFLLYLYSNKSLKFRSDVHAAVVNIIFMYFITEREFSSFIRDKAIS